MKKHRVKKVLLADLKPYWRNPRSNEITAEKLLGSLDEYGYANLMTVDKANTIITGHARLKALLKLNETEDVGEIDVLELDLPAEKAKEYRIIDNKSHEFATWIPADLQAELKELQDLTNVQLFFPTDLDEMLKTAAGAGTPTYDEEDMQKAEQQQGSVGERSMQGALAGQSEIICPACGHTFFVTGEA